MTGYYSLVIPSPCTNWITRTSVEIDLTNWSVIAGGVNTQSSTYQTHGLYSSKLVAAASGDGYSYDEPANTQRTTGIYSVSFWIKGAATYTSTIRCRVIEGGTTVYNVVIPTVDTTWRRISVTNVTLGQTHTVSIQILSDSAASKTIYVDGMQIESGTFITDFCNGDQEDCVWLGTPQASTSSRSAMTRAAGREYNFDDLNLTVEVMAGIGAPPVAHTAIEEATTSRTIYQSTQVKPRSIQLTIFAPGTDLANLHSLRNALVNYVGPEIARNQPFLLRYTGAGRTLEVRCVYDKGLEFQTFAAGMQEEIALTLLAHDPYWRALVWTSQSLTRSTSLSNTRYLAGRVGGVWETLGPPSAVTGGTPVVDAIAVGPDQTVYFGGDWTSFNGLTDNRRIARWNPVTRAWSGLGTAGGVYDGSVTVITIGADGTVYVGGTFTKVQNSGVDVASTAGIARWSPVTTLWSAVGTGVTSGTADVRAMAWTRLGSLIVGGAFGGMGGVANTVHLASWSAGGAWSALGQGTNATGVAAVAVAPSGLIYVGGAFTQVLQSDATIVSAAGIAVWNPATAVVAQRWSAMSSGVSGVVNCLLVADDGTLYIGGTTGMVLAGGVTVTALATWNGTGYAAVGGPLVVTTQVENIAFGPEGDLYAGGDIVSADGNTLSDGIARFDGHTWSHLTIDLPGTPYVWATAFNKAGDLYLGFNTTGTATSAAANTITNAGSAKARPKFVITRTGGTTSVLESIKNWTTNEELLFNIGILNGERLDIDLQEQTIISSFFGRRHDAILANSNFGTFGLVPGANLLTVKISGTGTTIYCTVRRPELSADGGSVAE